MQITRSVERILDLHLSEDEQSGWVGSGL